ncbi:hypothetical protein ABKW28_10535 [Nocardioides sp. 31GB23]|uniref:hypothetical protein n=1 Tax=Nocardioides sp. 31GB23 TaxID=3156065 RepID=UPI0032AEABA7
MSAPRSPGPVAPAPLAGRRRLLGVVKLGVVVAIIAVVTGTIVSGTTPSRAPVDPRSDRLTSLMAAYDCSTTGLDDGVVPGSAVLRSPEGALRMVTFERGWASYDGSRPGTLVAVCAAPLP